MSNSVSNSTANFKPLSSIATEVKASTTLAIDSLFKQMKADGMDVISFGTGEPDFNTPEHIKKAGIDAINDNFTRYTPAAGIMKLREAVCQRLSADCGVSYEPSQIIISSGAKHNLYLALQCLVNPGDEVILPAPYWVSYYELIKLAGGTPVVVTTGEKTQFKISAQQLQNSITSKTKALILNSPSNPSGMVYTKEELQQIADVCIKNRIYVIADDIYYKLIYGNTKFTSIASLGKEIQDLTILVNGVSKTYAMTGWRIGYSAANPTIAKVMANYQSHSTAAPCSVSQAAAVAALTGPQDCVEQMRREFEKRRDFICTEVNKIDGVSCLVPDGAFYIMVNVKNFFGKQMYGQTVNTSDDFAKLFLEKGLVASVPCSGFGSPEHIRFSYASSMEDIARGTQRLKEFIQNA